MGKFTFPLPGRRQKPAPSPSPPLVGPLSKAQKVLGTTQISVDSPTSSTLSPGSKWGWDTRSNSGISIAISETTASHTDAGETGLGIVHEGEVANQTSRREHRWEEESEIIPRTLNNRQSTMADTADASSLRRRQSSSTIGSYYDKAKLPLSISQQTANSAIAKGVPAKVHAMLDMDGTMSGSKDKKKKPAMLDLTSLLPKSISGRHLRPDHVLGPDMMTKSPSVMSMSPEMTPSPRTKKSDLFLRKKKTKESLIETQSPSESRQQTTRPSASANVQHRPTKSTVTQLNLYNHYEQRFFSEAMGQEADGINEVESPMNGHGAYPKGSKRSPGADSVPPLPTNNHYRMQHAGKQPPGVSLEAVVSPMSHISGPADSCSISSRHTRTSKASKRTDRSLTDLDLQKQSVLSLSSDSEDDGYEPSYNSSSLTVPPLSDGQISPTSPRSAMSGASGPQDQGRTKPPKRTSFAANPQFLPIPERGPSSNPPRSQARASPLSPNPTSKSTLAVSARPDLRMSIASTSTSKTLVFGVSANDHPHGPKIISMMRKNSASAQSGWSDRDEVQSFPTPPGHRAQRPSLASVNSEHPTPPLSPTSVDFYLQSHHTGAAPLDNGSIGSEKSNKADGRRRGSSTSSLNDSGSGRFMAVTRQEEMLLAALRNKRARMREDIIAEFEEDFDRSEHHLDRRATNGSSASSRTSRQSSASTMQLSYEAGSTLNGSTLTMRPRHHQQPQIRVSAGSTDKKVDANYIGTFPHPPVADDSIDHDDNKSTEPIPDLYDFIGFDNPSVPLPLSRFAVRPDGSERKRSSSSSSNNRSRSSSNTRTRSSSSAGIRQANTAAASTARPVPGLRSIKSDLPSQILEEEPLEDGDGVPRPDSPISPSDFPVPMSIARKKQLRLSAVGASQMNVEAGWWNESG